MALTIRCRLNWVGPGRIFNRADLKFDRRPAGLFSNSTDRCLVLLRIRRCVQRAMYKVLLHVKLVLVASDYAHAQNLCLLRFNADHGCVSIVFHEWQVFLTFTNLTEYYLERSSLSSSIAINHCACVFSIMLHDSTFYSQNNWKWACYDPGST